LPGESYGEQEEDGEGGEGLNLRIIARITNPRQQLNGG